MERWEREARWIKRVFRARSCYSIMWEKEDDSDYSGLLVGTYGHTQTRGLFEWVRDHRRWHGTRSCVPIESRDNERNRSNEGTRFRAAMTMVVNKINMSSYSAPRRTFFSGLHTKVIRNLFFFRFVQVRCPRHSKWRRRIFPTETADIGPLRSNYRKLQ